MPGLALARAGVAVKLLLDAVGSQKSGDEQFRELRAAGGRVAFYHPLRWYNFKRLNNRTHRDLVIVDGKVGFLGGAGVADDWLLDRPGSPRWRDTMVRVDGAAVPSLQGVFIENWLEAVEEVLTGDRYFPFPPGGPGGPGDSPGLVVNSSPSAGRATRARILFQVLLASARRNIHITTPYFLPDRSIRAELIKAIQGRGVSVIERAVQPQDLLATIYRFLGINPEHQFVNHAGRPISLLPFGTPIHELVG